MRRGRVVAAMALALMMAIAGAPSASAAEVTSTSCSWLPRGVQADRCVTIDASAGSNDVDRSFGRVRWGRTVAVQIVNSEASELTLVGSRSTTRVSVSQLDGKAAPGFSRVRNGVASSDACQGATSCAFLVDYTTNNRRSRAEVLLSQAPTEPPQPPPERLRLPAGHPISQVPADTPRYDGRTNLIQVDADVAADLGVPLCVRLGSNQHECVRADGSTFVVTEPSFSDPGSPVARDQVPNGIFFSRSFEDPPPPPPAPGTLPGFNKITQENLDLAIAEGTAVCVSDGVPWECVSPDGSRFQVVGSFEEPAWVLYPGFIFLPFYFP